MFLVLLDKSVCYTTVVSNTGSHFNNNSILTLPVFCCDTEQYYITRMRIFHQNAKCKSWNSECSVNNEYSLYVLLVIKNEIGPICSITVKPICIFEFVVSTCVRHSMSILIWIRNLLVIIYRFLHSTFYLSC